MSSDASFLYDTIPATLVLINFYSAVSSDESDGGATKRPTKRPTERSKTLFDAQWRKWQNTTLQIYKLAQRRLNVRQTHLGNL